MGKSRKTACALVGLGLLVLVTTSTSLARSAFAQDNTPANNPHSNDGVSKKILKELSSCQSKAAKDHELTETELDSCYNDSFPSSAPASNTTPQPASEPSLNTIPSNGPNQIAPMNLTDNNDLPIDKATINEIIKNRFGLGS